MHSAVYRFIIKPNYIQLLQNVETGEDKIRELAKSVNMSYFQLTVVLQHLEKDGYIKKVMDSHSYSISLTEKGRAINFHFGNIKTIVENWGDYKHTIKNKKMEYPEGKNQESNPELDNQVIRQARK